MKKKVKSKNNSGKTLTKTEKCDSFFNYFSPPMVPDDDTDMDEEEAKELQEAMELDYEFGEIIRNVIIPNAVNWFTGKIVVRTCTRAIFRFLLFCIYIY